MLLVMKKKYQKINLESFLCLILLIIFIFSTLSFADTIILKSGKKIKGKITEETDNFIRVNIEGIPITFYNSEIKSISKTKDNREDLIDNNLVKYSDERWLEGIVDYRKAQDIQKKTMAPIFLYIWTDLCRQSKEFEEKILDSSYFKENSKNIIKVKIHLDLSNKEEKVIKEFLCRDYPLLYVAYLGKKLRIYKKYNKIDGKWILKTPQEFISEIQRLKVILEKITGLDTNSHP